MHEKENSNEFPHFASSHMNVFNRLYKDSIYRKEFQVATSAYVPSKVEFQKPVFPSRNESLFEISNGVSYEFNSGLSEICLQELEKEIKQLEETSNLHDNYYSIESGFNRPIQGISESEANRTLELLDLNVLERNNHWAKRRVEKLEEHRKNLKEKELDGCTFKPILKKKANPNIVQPRAISVGKHVSYTQIHRHKLNGKTPQQAPVPTSYSHIHRRNTSNNK